MGKWTIVLKILATTAVNVYAYTGIVVLRAAIFGADGGLAAILLYISSIAFANLSNEIFLNRKPAFASAISKTKPARFAAFMLDIRDIERFAAVMAAWVFVLAPLAAGIFIFARQGTFRLLFELLSIAAAFIISLKHTRLGSAGIMGKTTVFTGFIIFLAALEMPNIFDRLKYLRPWLYGAAYFFILAYLIVRNQEDIDINIYDKKHVEKSILPKNLRRFNMLSVCAVFLIILLISNMKTVITALVKLLGKAMVLVIYGILWILELIMPKPGVIQENGAPGHNDLNFSFQGISPVGNFILNVLRNFAILYILYRILLSLARKIPSFARNIAGLLAKIFSLNKGVKPNEESEYTDESETVKPEWIRGHLKTVKKKQLKARKKLKYMTDPVEKVRCMYGIVLGMLQMSGIKTQPCDTTLDIVKKAASLVNIRKELSALTDVYNRVRYGGVVPDQAMMSEALSYYSKTVKGFGIPAGETME